MVALCSFRKEGLILSQLLLIGEGDTIDSLERIVVSISKEVRCRVLSDHESLNFTGVRNMGADTEIDHRATTVNGSRGAIRDFGVNEVLLVFIVL